MTKFSYKTEFYLKYNTTQILNEVEVPLEMSAQQLLANDLPQKGEEGWELVAVVHDNGGVWAYFKKVQDATVAASTPQGPKATEVAESAEPVSKRLPLFTLKLDAPVELSQTGSKVQTSLQVVSKPEGGIAFPQALPVQRSFPSRDYSTGYDANGSEVET